MLLTKSRHCPIVSFLWSGWSSLSDLEPSMGNENSLTTLFTVLRALSINCGISYVLKLNDKSFRPLFASLVRWAVSGEGSLSTETTEVIRLTAFFKFFNKVEDNLKSIITSYFSYLLDPTIAILKRFQDGSLQDTNLRRIILHSLASSFKYDQDDYWTHQLRFETMVGPTLGPIEQYRRLYR